MITGETLALHTATPVAIAQRESVAKTDAGKLREAWVDYAKGICIFFVVMFHVNDLVREQLGSSGWLDAVVTFSRPFRMPDFFLIAGLFLASAMRKPWSSYLDRKVVHFLYFYLLWMTFEFVLLDVLHGVRTQAEPTSLALAYLRRIIDARGPLWFIQILPVFFVLTRISRPVPRWVIWLGAAVLHSLDINTGWHIPDELASRFVFFYSGYVLAPHVFRIAAWAGPRAHAGLAYLAGWAVFNGLLVHAGVSRGVGVSLVLGYAGALAVVVTAVLLSRQRWSRPLGFLGEHSIVVYLGELLVGIVVVSIMSRMIREPGTLALTATLVTIAGTLVLWQLALRTPARLLYERPRRFRIGGE
jgi:uncharacterized membrane protein YcfT